MSTVTQGLDRNEAVFDEGSLVADAGLVAVGTLVGRLGLEGLLDETVRPPESGRGSGAWVDWSGGQTCRPCNVQADADSSTTAYRRLVGVEASMRKFFGVVIGRGNASHADHFHADAECPVGFSTDSADERLFARDCIIAFTNNSNGVKHDASTWSESRDQASLNSLLADLGMDCFSIKTNISEHMIFLGYIMMHAFADRAAGHYRWRGLADL